ncbi:FtsK/SpoIIIE domain-containing protein [Demequina activiva]|uniref:Cell division protein FtsK n=1 Tax=Demequina activiva TaxID=1582364 RepID=A0A919Q6W3_9MICO|nr:FtsK/SpoIIIE domain-containing protein [Demequina activiva]GIG54905.1 cell division protein FtsK [Demequina activiva]
MTRLRLTTPSDDGSDTALDWLVDVDDGTTVEELAAAIGVQPSALVGATGTDLTLHAAGVASGTNLARPHHLQPAGQLRLEIVGGPLSGHSVPLVPGQRLSIGAATDADVTIDDTYLEPIHAHVTLDAPEAGGPLSLVIEPAPGALVVRNGVTVHEDRFTTVPADVVQMGAHIMRLGMAPASDADLTQDETGLRGFNRPSRILPRTDEPIVSLPGERPEEEEGTPLPWLSAIVPVVLGVSMAMIFGRAVMLLMAAASPIMVVGSFLANRKLARRRGERTEATWREEIRDTEERIDSLVREQRIQSWYDQPDPVVIHDTATRPTARLWERRYDDPDALRVRIGVAQGDLRVKFEGGGQKFREQPHSAGVSPEPVSIDAALGPIGVAGTAHATRLVARAALASVATLRSPRDCQIVVICDDDPDQWAWTSWLPHTHEDARLGATIGNTEDSRRERLRELAATLQMRRLASAQGVAAGSHIFVVLDGARRYRMLPGMVELLKHGHHHGIFVLALDDDRSRLPEEAATVIEIDRTDAAMARVQSRGEFHARVLLDGMSLAAAEEIARTLCGYHHISGIGDDGVMPRSVRYVDLLGVDLERPEPILERWSRTPRQTYVVVGADADGEVAIDLATAGPHALVAGTTGSGKSEFLQTLIIALAMANRPDALNFVLVDYKGGSAFADCERLPHTVGMVTNLDARETERALASLEAELKRRERVLKDEIGAKDVDVAWAKNPEAAAAAGLARLVLVIDEFAELKTELPDFINGLVRIARVGRSLGVHLVLATQRPSGAVTPEMQSNINMRVALRVTDQADSSDVLGSGEAALISTTTPGRGYIKAGANQAPTAFQAARVAGVRPGTVAEHRGAPPAARVDWEVVAYALQFPPEQVRATANVDHDDTDLRALVNVVLAAAERAGIPKNASPWLTPLPPVLTLDHFVGQRLPSGALIIGLEDIPGEQRQAPRLWHLLDDSHMLIAGGARSGRTTALRSLMLQMVQRFSPQDLHLYGIDYGNGALLPFDAAPHTGAIVPGLEAARVSRLLDRLLAELTRRQGLLSAAGVGSLAEQRARESDPAARLPIIAMVVDGWERASATMTPDEMTALRDKMMRIVREGPATGMTLVLSGDRTLPADRIAGAVNTTYVLPMRDIADYRSAGIMIRELPEDLPAGRAMHGADGRELQWVVHSPEVSGEAQHRHAIDVIASVASHWSAVALATHPMRVDTLPGRISLADALALPAAEGCDPANPVVAVGGDELSRFTVDVGAGQHLLVTGERASGKSTVLAALCTQLARRGDSVLAVAPRSSPLAQAAAAAGVPVVTDTATDAATLGTPPPGRTVVLVDDADTIRDTPLEAALMMDGANRTYVAAARTGSVATAFSGPIAEAKKAARGIVLQPASSLLGTQALGQSIPKALVGRGTPGEGALFLDGDYVGVRVPLPE